MQGTNEIDSFILSNIKKAFLAVQASLTIDNQAYGRRLTQS